MLAMAVAASAFGCQDIQPLADDSASSNPERASEVAADEVHDEPSACAAPEGVSGSPNNVAEVLTLLNALPKPVSLPCFLRALSRPLAIHATESIFSLQQAAGKRSPRIFVFFEGLIFSVVPEGTGSHLVEFGETRPDNRSLKAELEFPIPTELSDSDPFEGFMLTEDATNCAICHDDEELAQDITYARAYVSQSLQPAAGQRVDVESLQGEQLACDSSAEAERCAMLDAIFDQGNVVETQFPSSFDTL